MGGQTQVCTGTGAYRRRCAQTRVCTGMCVHGHERAQAQVSTGIGVLRHRCAQVHRLLGENFTVTKIRVEVTDDPASSLYNCACMEKSYLYNYMLTKIFLKAITI